MTDEQVIASLTEKDADFLEKFVLKVLQLAIDYWGKKAQEATKSGAPGGDAEYITAFDQWHRLRLNLLLVEQEISAKHDRLQEATWELTGDTTTSASLASEGG